MLAMVMRLVIADAPRPPAAPEVTVTTVAAEGDSVLTGRLLEFSLERGLRLELVDSGETREIRGEDVITVRVRGDDAAVRPPADRVEIRLAGGDRLFGRVAGGEDDRVEIESVMLGRIAVPLERIDGWSRGPARTERRGAEGDEPTSPEDILVLSNGDVIRGMVLAIDETGFAVEAEGSEVRVPHERIASADLVAEALPSAEGLRGRLRLIDGSRITSSEISFGEGGIALRPFGGERLTCTVERVARIDVAGGRWVWLSDLAPISVQHTPMISLDRPHVADANVMGRPMRIVERSFEHGLGVHTESSLLYELAGQFSHFVTWLGVDDAGGPLSDVTAEIRVDGKTAYRKEHLRRGQLVGPVRIDVRGAGRIELAAHFGDNAGIQDVFNWADAGLVR